MSQEPWKTPWQPRGRCRSPRPAGRQSLPFRRRRRNIEPNGPVLLREEPQARPGPWFSVRLPSRMYDVTARRHAQHPDGEPVNVGKTAPVAAKAAAIDAAQARPLTWKAVVKRALAIAVAGVAIYLVLPKLIAVLGAWPRLSTLNPAWFAACVAAELLSFTCNFALQRLALRTKDWFPVITAGLAGNAVTNSLPGGSAAGAAVQFHMLTTAGFDTDTAIGGLTAFSLLGVGGLLMLPIFALPAILAGVPVSRGLVRTALLGIAAFVLYAVFGMIVLRTDWPLAKAGRVAQSVWNRVTRGHRQPVTGLDQRLLAERDTIRAVLGENWRQAVLLTAGRLGFDYGCLLAALRATGAEPQPSLVLLAYSAAGIIALFPLTPGGLGIVEASLSGLLILAGVRAGYAVLAILSYWLPLLAGPPAYLLFRHRYGRPAPQRATPGEAGSTA